MTSTRRVLSDIQGRRYNIHSIPLHHIYYEPEKDLVTDFGCRDNAYTVTVNIIVHEVPVPLKSVMDEKR